MKGLAAAKKAAFDNPSILPDDCRVLLYKHVGLDKIRAVGHEKFKELIFDLLRQQIDNPEEAWGEEVEELVAFEIAPLTDQDHAEFESWVARCDEMGIPLDQGLMYVMRKPLGKNEIKRVARIWAASFLTFYISDFSEDMEGDNTSEEERRAIYTEIERIGDRIRGKDIERSHLYEAVDDVLEDRRKCRHSRKQP